MTQELRNRMTIKDVPSTVVLSRLSELVTQPALGETLGFEALQDGQSLYISQDQAIRELRRRDPVGGLS